MTDRFFELAEQINAGSLRGMSTANLAETLRTHAQAPMTDLAPPDAMCSQELPQLPNGLQLVTTMLGFGEMPAIFPDLLALIPKLTPEQKRAIRDALLPDRISWMVELERERDEARRNEAVRAQERDEAIASGKVLVEANLRHFNTAAENHNRAEALWNELAEMTKRAEAAEKDRDLANQERDNRWQIAKDARERLAPMTAERDALLSLLDTCDQQGCTNRATMYRNGEGACFELRCDSHACPGFSDNDAAPVLRRILGVPLVTDTPAAEWEAATHGPCELEDDDDGTCGEPGTREILRRKHDGKIEPTYRCLKHRGVTNHCWEATWCSGNCAFGKPQFIDPACPVHGANRPGQCKPDPVPHPAVAMAEEAIQEKNDATISMDEWTDEKCNEELRDHGLERSIREAIKRRNARIRDLESQLAAALAERDHLKTELRGLSEVLEAERQERDAAVERSQNRAREAQVRAIRWAANEAWPGVIREEGVRWHALHCLADRVERGEVTP